MKAMILAAGLGTRLLPYTLKRPKPLFPILNKPLLGLTISRIKKAGFSEIVVNAHHLRHQIKEALQYETDIVLQEEEKILGTGGGLRLALPELGHEPVLVVNGDIYHSIDYRNIYRFHCKTQSEVTLVVHDFPRFNSITMDQAGCVTSFDNSGTSGNKNGRMLAFTGIHVINPDILGAIQHDTASCIIDLVSMESSSAHINIDGVQHTARFHTPRAGKLYISIDGRAAEYRDLIRLDGATEQAGGGGRVIAPMHGLLLEVRVAQGDEVAAGQTLAVLEAMKMHYEIVAEAAGTVRQTMC